MNRSGFWWALGGLLAVFPVPVQAQTVFQGEASQSVNGVRAFLLNSSTGDSFGQSLLSEQTLLRLGVLQTRPRLSLGGDLRLLVGIDPNLVQYLPTDSSTGTAETGVAVSTRIQPDLTLGLNARPNERMVLGVSNRLSVLVLRNRDAGGVGIEPSGSTPSSDLSTPPETGVGQTSASYSTLTLQPQDSWVNDAQITLGRAPGLRFTPGVTGQYRVFRQFDCVDTVVTSVVGTSLLAQNYQTDTASAKTDFIVHTSESQRLGGSLMFSREDNRAMPECPEPPAPFPARSSHVFYQLAPTAIYGWGALPWVFSLEAGGVAVWGRLRQPDGALVPNIDGLDFRPQGMLNVVRSFPWGDVRARTGVQVATLLGQPAPTYNLVAESSAGYRRYEPWSVHGTVSYLHAFLISDYYLQSGLSSAAGTSMLLGQLAFEWHPIYWFRGTAGYTVTLQNTRKSDNAAIVQNSAPIASFDRMLLNTVSLMATFTLDRGLSAALLPKLAGRP